MPLLLLPHADIELAIRAAVFGAVGTCGQRCTSTRRLIVHESIVETFTTALKKAYGQLRIGNPLDEKNHVGPLIDAESVTLFEEACKKVENQGGKWIVKGAVLDSKSLGSHCYVKPAVALIDSNAEVVQEETFAPLLYVLPYKGTIERCFKNSK